MCLPLYHERIGYDISCDDRFARIHHCIGAAKHAPLGEPDRMSYNGSTYTEKGWNMTEQQPARTEQNITNETGRIAERGRILARLAQSGQSYPMIKALREASAFTPGLGPMTVSYGGDLYGLISGGYYSAPNENLSAAQNTESEASEKE